MVLWEQTSVSWPTAVGSIEATNLNKVRVTSPGRWGTVSSPGGHQQLAINENFFHPDPDVLP